MVLLVVLVVLEGRMSQGTMDFLRTGPAARLIAFKTYFDLQAHREEHGLTGTPPEG